MANLVIIGIYYNEIPMNRNFFNAYNFNVMYMNVKNLIKNIVIPNVLGFIGSIIGNVKNGFKGMIKPKIIIL